MQITKPISFFYCILLLLTISTSAYHTESEAYNPVQLIKTRLKFYLHDTLSGSNPSAVKIAGPDGMEYDPVPFGSLLVMDDPMTAAPEVVGNGRGMYVSARRGGGEDVVFVTYAGYAFTSGRFNGSSLSVLSRNAVMDSSRELAVVGGRGQLEMAVGTATVSFDAATGDAVLEYKVEVVHPVFHGGLGFL